MAEKRKLKSPRVTEIRPKKVKRGKVIASSHFLQDVMIRALPGRAWDQFSKDIIAHRDP